MNNILVRWAIRIQLFVVLHVKLFNKNLIISVTQLSHDPLFAWKVVLADGNQLLILYQNYVFSVHLPDGECIICLEGRDAILACMKESASRYSNFTENELDTLWVYEILLGNGYRVYGEENPLTGLPFIIK